MNVTGTIPASLESVLAWLRDRQRRRGRERIEALDGYYEINVASFPLPGLFGAEYAFDLTSDFNQVRDGEHRVFVSVFEPAVLARFRLLRLGEHRCQLVIETRHDWMADYLRELEREARLAWPDADIQGIVATARNRLSPEEQRYIDLWNEGFTAEEIGERINRSTKTVFNRITQLRKRYGEGLVPSRAPKTGK